MFRLFWSGTSMEHVELPSGTGGGRERCRRPGRPIRSLKTSNRSHAPTHARRFIFQITAPTAGHKNTVLGSKFQDPNLSLVLLTCRRKYTAPLEITETCLAGLLFPTTKCGWTWISKKIKNGPGVHETLVCVSRRKHRGEIAHEALRA